MPVADVFPSVNNKYVECIECDGKVIYISLFAYAKGMLISDNGYRYREGNNIFILFLKDIGAKRKYQMNS